MVGKNRQLFINMGASFLTFLVGIGINFFLTPYIVRKLGVEAYGFVALSNNIINYTGLLTIALNAMASRFIAVKYQKGDLSSACKYFSSVFYSNIILAGFITIILSVLVIELDFFLDIPQKIVPDVKLLFVFLSLTNIAYLLTGVYGVGTYIKNRLDLNSIRSIVANIIRCASLVSLFAFFVPHVWYVGLSGFLMTIYTVYTNIKLTKKLTPELKFQKSNFEWIKVKELLISGSWNLIIKLGEILGNGLDLLFANLFIGPVAMGVFSISKSMPLMIQSMMGAFSGVFGPQLLQAYTTGTKDELVSEFKKSIRILSFLAGIPLVLLFTLGKDFYTLWMPTQDSSWLYTLTLVGSMSLAISLPSEGLWNIFTIVNKVKYASCAVLLNNGLTFIVIFSSMFFVESLDARLIILACTKSVLKIVLSLTFLPIASSKCMNIRKSLLYPTLLRGILCILISIIVCKILSLYIIVNGWLSLISISSVFVVITLIVSSCIILQSEDLKFIKTKILKRKSNG